MVLPSNENLKAKVARPNTNYDQRIENLKSSLKQAYKSVREASRKSHQINKRAYDRRAKHLSFKTVYTYTVPHGNEAYQKNSIVGLGHMRLLPKYPIWTTKYQAKMGGNLLFVSTVLSLLIMMWSKHRTRDQGDSVERKHEKPPCPAIVVNVQTPLRSENSHWLQVFRVGMTVLPPAYSLTLYFPSFRRFANGWR